MSRIWFAYIRLFFWPLRIFYTMRSYTVFNYPFTRKGIPHPGMRRVFEFAVISFLVCIALVGCTKKADEEITAGELRTHVSYLASDPLQGRYTGTPGVAEAEQYIADRFAEIGLSPLPGETDYFLEFELNSVTYDAANTFVSIKGRRYELSEDFKPFYFSDNGEVESEAVFAGYGITAPEYDYNDYDGLDVNGKIVIVMRYEPDWFKETGNTKHAYFQTKAENAVAHGAAGMLLYTDPKNKRANEDLRATPAYTFENRHTTGRQDRRTRVAEGFVAFHVSSAIASALLPDIPLSDLQRAVDSRQPIPEIIKDMNHRATIGMKQTPTVPGNIVGARNVAAFLPGTGSKDDEWIVVGAHHDHIGSYTGSGDTIYNGADDNASGVAGVLELAEQFTIHPPERSMVFITFSAEEIGLFGSYALDTFDLIELDKVGFMLNLDMIGRNPELPVEIYGDGLAEGLTDLVRKANKEHRVSLALQGRKYEPFSDIAVFHDNRIPFIMFFTGVHSDYHGIGDHADKLDYPRMEKILRLSYDILDLAAGAERLPRFN